MRNSREAAAIQEIADLLSIIAESAGGVYPNHALLLDMTSTVNSIKNQ